MNTALIRNVLEDTISLTSCNCPEGACDGTCTYSQAKTALESLDTPVHLAIFLDGGLVQEVVTDRPAKVVKVNLDIDGADDDDLTDFPERFIKPSRAYVSVDDSADGETVKEDPEYVERLFKSQE